MPQSMNRRSVAAAIGVGLATLGPTMALAKVDNSPIERIKHHARELERAMRDCYGGAEVTTLTFDDKKGCKPRETRWLLKILAYSEENLKLGRLTILGRVEGSMAFTRS